MSNTYTATQGKPVGTLVFGKHLVRQLSDRQASFIEKLMSERKFDATRIPTDVDGSINVRQASRIIDYLLSCEYAVARLATPKQLSFLKSLIEKRVDTDNRADNIDYATLTFEDASALITYFKEQPESVAKIDVGAYIFEGVKYSVRKNVDNDYLYAVHWLEDEKRFSERDYRIVKKMTMDMKMSFEDAQLFGIQTGVCIYCHKVLTDIKSVAMGMGEWCFKKHHKN